jgi:uncharacterized protein YukE
MATVGAELETLRQLHSTFVQKAQEALDIKSKVNSGLASTVWTGTYATNFHQSWTEYSKNLDHLNQALTGAASDVRTNHNNIAEATGESDRI